MSLLTVTYICFQGAPYYAFDVYVIGCTVVLLSVFNMCYVRF